MPVDRDRVQVPYRGHTIIATTIKGAPTAAIYLGRAAATLERFPEETIEGAVECAKQWIDSKYRATSALRAAPHIATAQEYLDALRARPPKENELAMLRAHVREGILTATQLADAAGYASYSSANVHYGGLGRAICEILHLQPQMRADGSPIWTTVLASGFGEVDEASPHFRWKIHSQLVEALLQLGLCGRQR